MRTSAGQLAFDKDTAWRFNKRESDPGSSSGIGKVCAADQDRDYPRRLAWARACSISRLT